MNATKCVHLMKNVNVMNTSNGNSFVFYTKTQPCGDNQKGVIPIVFLRLQVKRQLGIHHFMLSFMLLFILASWGPYGPLLARSGYPGQDAFFYNCPMVMICATVNALIQLKTMLCEFGQICANRNALMLLKTILCKF